MRNIYFIKVGDAVKIGIATNVKSRLHAIQNGNAEKCELLFSCKGSSQHEKDLHKRFHDYHLRGEWFKYDGDLKAHIQRMASLPEAGSGIHYWAKEQITTEDMWGSETIHAVAYFWIKGFVVENIQGQCLVIPENGKGNPEIVPEGRLSKEWKNKSAAMLTGKDSNDRMNELYRDYQETGCAPDWQELMDALDC